MYGAMSKIGLLRIFLLQFKFVGFFASSNPSLPESSCRHFFPCMYGCYFEFKMADLYMDRKIKLLQSSWKVCHLVRLIIRILKMYGLLYVQCLVTELWAKCKKVINLCTFFWSKMTLFKYASLRDISLVFQIMKSPIYMQMSTFDFLIPV